MIILKIILAIIMVACLDIANHMEGKVETDCTREEA